LSVYKRLEILPEKIKEKKSLCLANYMREVKMNVSGDKVLLCKEQETMGASLKSDLQWFFQCAVVIITVVLWLPYIYRAPVCKQGRVDWKWRPPAQGSAGPGAVLQISANSFATGLLFFSPMAKPHFRRLNFKLFHNLPYLVFLGILCGRQERHSSHSRFTYGKLRLKQGS
jgi:hypothetical protein